MENSEIQQPQGKPNRKLKNFLIYPRYQIAMVIANSLIFVSGFVAVYYQVSSSFYNLDEVAAAKNIMASPYYKELVLYQEKFILNTIFTTLIWTLLFVIFFTVLFSHKSAGAIFGLQKYFQDIAKNGYQRPLTFRKNDLHQELPGVVNSAIAKIMNDVKNKKN